ITRDNERRLKVTYEVRNEDELPVLIAYFNKKKQQRGAGEAGDSDEDEDAVEVPPARYLDVILYSREQIASEYAAMGHAPPTGTAPYGIISIKGQTVDHEIPMQPITM